MTDLFAAVAPAYWAKGIPVMPLGIMSKAPIITGWRDYAREMPSEFVREQWMKLHRTNNIGLPAGAQAGMVFIDIDTTDPALEAAIMKIIPMSPWKRIGQKGCMLAYKYNGEPCKNISAKAGGMIVEIISDGRQIVMPPSIHPDTQQPYTSNCELLDVLDQLPSLPKDVYDRLRAALSGLIELGNSSSGDRHNMMEFVSAGARDVSMTRQAGFLAFCVMQGHATVLKALDDMVAWCDSKVMKVEGDQIDVAKGCSKVIEFIKNDIESGKILPPGWDEALSPADKIKWNLDFTEDQKEWTASQLNEYMFEQFNACAGPSDPKRKVIVDYVLGKLAKATSMQQLDEDAVLKNLCDNSGLGLKPQSYKVALRDLRKGPLDGANHTEIARAVVERWIKREGQIACWQGTLWGWEGDHWKKLDNQKFLDLIATEYGHLPAAKKLQDHKGILGVIFNILPQHLSAADVEGVNFLNGFLTKELKLLTHQPEQGATYVLPYCYRPELSGKCPKFFNYLYKSWGHAEDSGDKIRALREAMAVTLFGVATTFQRAFLLYGPGGTGKSVLLDIIEGLVPPEAQCAVAPDKWKARFAPAQLIGKLLNRAGELSNTQNIPGETFKQLITGEAMDAEFPYRGFVPFRSKAAQWFAGNCLPKTKDVSNGFNRRWLILGFDKLVTKEDKVLEYGKIIARDEMEAIVSWVVEVFPDLLRAGDYTIPKSHTDLLTTMANTNSDVRAWYASRVLQKEGAKTDGVELWGDFWGFQTHRMSGKRIVNTEFHRELQDILKEESRCFLEGSDDSVKYLGLSLKQRGGR